MMNKESTESCLLNIQQSISDFKRSIKLITENNFEKAHLIIGFTGQGKSTLLNYIADNPLIGYKPKNKPYLIRAVDQIESIKIGLGKKSTTTVPNLWIDKQRKNTFWDCPGFSDNKGPEQNIKNAYYIWQILRNCKELKVILVVSESSLVQGRAVNFIKVLEQVQNMFSDVEKICDSTTLVITQTRQLQNKEGIRQNLNEILQQLEKQQKGLSQKQKYLINHLASEKAKVVLFPAPSKEGAIEQKGAEQIRQSMESSKFLLNPQSNRKLAPQLKSYLSELASALNVQIEEICNSSNQHMNQKFSQIINQSQSQQSFKYQVSNIIRNLQPMCQSLNQSQFMANWIKIVITYDLKLQIKKVYNLKNLIKFIKSVNQKVEFSLQKWQKKFEVFYQFSRLNTQPQVIFANEDSTLKIKSYLLRVKLIKQTIENYLHNGIQLVVIECYHTLFVDQDLILPGISLLVISENWKVIGDCKIDLKGAGGQDYFQPAEGNRGFNEEGIGLDGINGLPGKPGQTGGSFFGKVRAKKHTFGPGTLMIDVRGGNGGKGQDGGAGGEGRKGKNASQTQQVDKRDPDFLVSRVLYKWQDKDVLEKINQVWKTLVTFNAQMLETYRSVGQQGCKGGNGGRGGVGGLPGRSGSVKFEGFKAQVFEGEGDEGKAGLPGAKGKGGENGYKYEGEYINQTVFTAFRDNSKNIVEGQQKQLYPVIQQKVEQKKEQKSTEAIKIAAQIIGPHVAKQAVQQATQQTAVQAASVMASIATWGSSGYQLVANEFMSLVSAGQSLLFPSLQQTAQQSAIQSTINNALSVVGGGITTFGISLGIQAGMSIASSMISSSWKSKPSLQPNGRGQSGESPETYNEEGREISLPPYTIEDQKIQRFQFEFSLIKLKY